MTSNPQRARLSTAKKFIFSVIIFLLLFLSIEGLLRLGGFSFSPERLQWGAEWGVWEDPTLPWSWIPKPGAVCHLEHSVFRWNQLGYRGPMFQLNKPPNTLRIICLGDSVTMGWYVPDDKTYCFQLQQLLAGQLNEKVETINGGVMGYTSYQGLHELQTRILDLKPDIITISYNWNDHSPAKKKIEDKDLNSGMTSFQLLSQLRLFQLVEFSILHFKGSTPVVPTTQEENDTVRVRVEDYRKNLAEMVELAKEHNITPILITEPCGAEWRAGMDRPEIEKIGKKQPIYNHQYNQVMQKVAAEKGILYIDMVPVFRQRRPRLFDAIHPAPAGHRAIAEEIARIIKQKYQTQKGSL